MAMRHRSICYLAAAAILLLPLTAAAQGTVRIVQTNSAGDNVHFIDPVTNEVVGVVDGIERAIVIDDIAQAKLVMTDALLRKEREQVS